MRPRFLRFLFYGGVLALLAFMLVGSKVAGKEPAFWTLSGHTDQGDAIRFHLDAGRRVRTFELRADGYCSSGGVTSSGWHPSEGGAPARFGSRGPRFDATEFRLFKHPDGSSSTVYFRIRGVISGERATGLLGSVPRKHAAGSLRFTSSYFWPDGTHQECDSGPVSYRTT